MRKKRFRSVHIALVAMFGIALAWYLARSEPLKVETGLVECAPMQVTIAAEGRTRMRERFVVSSPVEGNLGRMTVREGQFVKRGATLTWITPAPLEIRSELQRQAALQAAEAEKQAAEAQAARARVTRDQAARELNRIAALVEHGIRSNQELDTARSVESSAQQEFSAAALAADAAAFRVQELSAALLKPQGHAIAVRAPVDGIVLRVIQQSERIVMSGVPIVEIGDPNQLELVFEVLSTDAVKIKPGANVAVQNWGGEQVLEGHIRLIEPAGFTKLSALGVEEQRVNVIADFDGEVPPLGDGYRVEGKIVVWRSPEAVQVPVSALFRNGTEWSVFVIDDNRRAVIRTIKIGHRSRTHAEVFEGLQQGEVVILYPDDRLIPGATVRVNSGIGL